MSYNPDTHLTTAEQCPERIRLRTDDLVSYQCLRLEHHPGAHAADVHGKQATWWTPEGDRS